MQCGGRAAAPDVVDRGEPLVEGAAVGKPRQRVGIGDALVFVEFAADLIHLLAALLDASDGLLAMRHRLPVASLRSGQGAGQEKIVRKIALRGDPLQRFPKQLAVAFRRALFLTQQFQERIEFD